MLQQTIPDNEVYYPSVTAACYKFLDKIKQKQKQEINQ